MASTTALFTGLTGLFANARNLDVIGNNVANVNTTSFKASRMLFAAIQARQSSIGTPPGASTGGTNPNQTGQGVQIAATQRDFRAGSLQATGDPRDLAIDGAGFFVVNRGTEQLYTRAGAFRLNAVNELTTVDGDRVQGFAADENFELVDGRLADIRVPVGSLTVAQATRSATLAGNLNAAGELPTTGAAIAVSGPGGRGLQLITDAPDPLAPPVRPLDTSTLASIEDPLRVGSGAPLLPQGTTLELSGAERGGRRLPAARLAIGAATTVSDLLSFITASLGIRAAPNNPDGGVPGVTLDTSAGTLRITGNSGTASDLTVDGADFRLLDASGAYLRAPFGTDKSAAATGESVRTTSVVYDSLGAPIDVDVTMSLQSRGESGTVWQYDIRPAGVGPAPADGAGTGFISFDPFGRLTTIDSIDVSIDRPGSGAVNPLDYTLMLRSTAAELTALADEDSQIAVTSQDGSPIGTLSAYGVGADGTVSGTFTNGLTRTLGRIPLATFTNETGLVDNGSNTFRIGPNSGDAVLTTAGTLGSGRIASGSLELSNVDLGQEFIKMILTNTGYTASSRVIRTTDELMQQLLVIGR